MSDEIDYKIEFSLPGKENIIYLPCTDDYKIIAEAVIKVCSLFDPTLPTEGEIEKEQKCVTDRKKGDLLLICTEGELSEMVKFHDSYWIKPKELELKHILDPTAAHKFKDHAEKAYNQLMSRISHR